MVIQGFFSKDNSSTQNHEHSKNPLHDEIVLENEENDGVCWRTLLYLLENTAEECWRTSMFVAKLQCLVENFGVC